jgi:hypothetical protein
MTLPAGPLPGVSVGAGRFATGAGGTQPANPAETAIAATNARTPRLPQPINVMNRTVTPSCFIFSRLEVLLAQLRPKLSRPT